MWSTSVDVTTRRSKVKDSSNDETQITRELQWMNSWDFKNTWFTSLDIGGSNTKVDKIRTGNLSFTAGQNFEDSSRFQWSFTLGSNSLRQSDSNGGQPVLSLIQRKSAFQIGFSPLETLSFSVFVQQYSYDKDVDDQITRLSDPAALQRYGTAFSDALLTLPNSEVGLSGRWTWSEKFGFSWSVGATEDAPEPQVTGRFLDLAMDYQVNSNWDASVLVGSTQYKATATTPESQYQYLGLSLGYGW